jgi:putative DNA primase/helicase
MTSSNRLLQSPIDRVIGKLRSGGCNPKETGANQWKSKCPAHKGKSSNLSIKEGEDGTVLLRCHRVDDSGQPCSSESIVQALGLEMKDLFVRGDGPTRIAGRSKGKAKSPGSNGRNGKVWRSPEEAVAFIAGKEGGQVSKLGPWIYKEPGGFDLMRVYRIDLPGGKKSFLPVHPDHAGWHIGDPAGPLPLYHLDELAEADTVYVLEGEKCADRVRALGIVATTSSHGAESPHRSNWAPLAGKTVVMIPDNDKAGEGYIAGVGNALSKLAPAPVIKVLRLRLTNDGDDVEQWLESGIPETWEPDQCRAELERLGAEAPAWEPPAEVRPPPDETTGANVICAADVEPREIEWLWAGRLALGMLTTMAGDPKNGKSMTTLDVAGRLSRGAPFPDGSPCEVGSTIILSAEDDVSRVIVPRLRAMGANLSKIHFIESVRLGKGREALPSLDQDVEAIEREAKKLGDCKLIVVDPVSAYLGNTDDHKNTAIRGVLSPLKAMAERLGVSVILVTHLSKGGGTNSKHRVIGSIAYIGACRTNFIFIRDRADPTGRRVLMCDNGNNLGPQTGTLGFVIENRGEGPTVEWIDGPIDITAEQALAAESEAFEDTKGAPERRSAEAFLSALLKDKPLPYKEIEEAAKNSGVSVMTLRRAKTALGVIVEKIGFDKGTCWKWRLPDESKGTQNACKE